MKFVIDHDGDVNASVKHILKVLRWRKEKGVNRVLKERHLIPEIYFERGMAYYRNTDKMGRPIGYLSQYKFKCIYIYVLKYL